ncbi:hypothetical protein BHE74_00050893 [Ensete ventricosum]|nr:hypothetical protein BHE74_00050893 [Ensete ventricosum]RZR96965.1 hypothetical protein BHM03_00026061 [Ensete ventricosum]
MSFVVETSLHRQGKKVREAGKAAHGKVRKYSLVSQSHYHSFLVLIFSAVAKACHRKGSPSLSAPGQATRWVPWSPCARSKRSCCLGLHHAQFSARTAQAKSSRPATPHPKLHSPTTYKDSPMEYCSREEEVRC